MRVSVRGALNRAAAVVLSPRSGTLGCLRVLFSRCLEYFFLMETLVRISETPISYWGEFLIGIIGA